MTPSMPSRPVTMPPPMMSFTAATLITVSFITVSVTSVSVAAMPVTAVSAGTLPLPLSFRRLVFLLLCFIHGNFQALLHHHMPYTIRVLLAQKPINKCGPDRCHGDFGTLCSFPITRVAAAI